MKNDFSDMITTFKLFEAMSEVTTPSYLMTLSEYKEKVSPILKSFWKFISKNTEYLKHSWLTYGGVNFLTWDEYLDEAKKRWQKKEDDRSWEKTFDESWEKEYAEKQWPDHKQAPKEVIDTYKEFMIIFSKIFGKENLTKIENDETNSSKRSVRRALDDQTYVNLLKDGKLEYEKFEEIVTSVGLKIPAGFNKKLNFKPKVKVIEKTPEDILKIYNSITKCLSALNDRKVSVYDIGPRMTKNMYRISYQDVGSFKFIVDNYNFLTPEQKSTLESIPDYKKFIDKAKTYIEKAGEKDINFAEDSVYIKIIEEIKVKIQPAIDEHKEEIRRKIIEKQDGIKLDKKTMSEEEFKERYGHKVYDIDGKTLRGISMSSFQKSELGQLLIWNQSETEKYIKDSQDAYQQREHSKLSVMFYRLKYKFPNIVEFKFNNFIKSLRTGFEFFVDGYDSDGVIYNISTQTIFAGGKNIQIFHMRWLMEVSIDGKRVASFTSENK